MRLVGRPHLTALSTAHSDAKKHVDTWIDVVEKANWYTPHDVRATLPKVSIIGGKLKLAAFDIYRNNYRILASIDYKRGIVRVIGAGTHKEYDKWDTK
jgi:mRNA interferase HigB